MTTRSPRRALLAPAVRHAVNAAAWRIGQQHARQAAAELTARLYALAAGGADDAALLAAIDSPPILWKQRTMTDLDPIYQTLLAAAAPVIVSALNALPAGRQAQVVTAYESGGWPEIQVGVLNEAAYVRLIVRNADGAEHELARVDHRQH